MNNTEETTPNESSIHLQKLKKATEIIEQSMTGSLDPPIPILTRGEQKLIFPKTINVIQGKTGVHKSRFASSFCVALLKNTLFCWQPDLELKANFSLYQSYTVVYIDTERNLTYDLPNALRNILGGACLEPTVKPANFEFTSLVNVYRGKNARLHAIKEYLTSLRKETTNHLFVVLDVVSDCVGSFNDEEESRDLVDYLNYLVNETDTTFLTIIHENPNSSKARGHLGTELSNKTSTVLQISRYGSGENSEVFKVETLKNRNQGPAKPFFVQYDNSSGLLTTADGKAVKSVNGRNKVDVDNVTQLLPNFLTETKTRSEVLDHLSKLLNCGERVLEDLLKDILDQRIQMRDSLGEPVILDKTNTKPVRYSLAPLSTSADEPIQDDRG